MTKREYEVVRLRAAFNLTQKIGRMPTDEEIDEYVYELFQKAIAKKGVKNPHEK